MGILAITDDDVEEAVVLKDISDLQSAVSYLFGLIFAFGFWITKINQIYFWGNWEGVYGNGHSLLCKSTVPENQTLSVNVEILCQHLWS